MAVHPELRAIWFALQDPGLDMLIDWVDSDSGLAVPYVLMDRQLSPNIQVLHRMQEMAEVLGLYTMQEYLPHDYRRYQLQRSLSGAVLNSLQVPCVTMEIGRRRHVLWNDVLIGLAVLWVGCLFISEWCLKQIVQVSWNAHQPLVLSGVWRRDNGRLPEKKASCTHSTIGRDFT